MKKTIALILATILLLVALVGCSDKPLVRSDFPDEPYLAVEDGDPKLSEKDMNSMISKISTKQYECYPNLQNIPLAATLYKNGQKHYLSVDDPRIIALINLYNNSIYYSQYSYTQGLFDIHEIEEFEKEPFRLELIYDSTARYDTIIVTNGTFVAISHSRGGYEGLEERYPFDANGHYPLHYNTYRWLDLFGF